MDFTKQGLTYILLFIPTFLALTVLGQGVSKLQKKDPQGNIEVGFGIFLVILIAATYFLFIK